MFECLVKCTVEFNEFDIQYKLRSTIKSQALADFIVECNIPDGIPTVLQEPTKEGIALSRRPWIFHVDRSSTSYASGIGVILTSPTGETIEYALHFAFFVSNNEAEYEALLIGLKLVEELGVSELRVFNDSQLIVKKVRGELEARMLAQRKTKRRVNWSC